jgi:hypothetical protein
LEEKRPARLRLWAIGLGSREPTSFRRAESPTYEAPQSGNGGKGIFYQLAHLTNPSGVKYEDGIDPEISVNNDNKVILPGYPA